jgi:hypothetical protein
MTVSDVRVWADGFGLWHASQVVPTIGEASGVRGRLRDAIVAQIVEREESPKRTADMIREGLHNGGLVLDFPDPKLVDGGILYEAREDTSAYQ